MSLKIYECWFLAYNGEKTKRISDDEDSIEK